MNFSFNRDEFAKALQRVGSIVEKKTTMPILGNILLEVEGDQVSISATDLEIGIRTSSGIESGTDGKICVPARNLLEIIKELPDEKGSLSRVDNDWLEVKSGRAVFKIVGVAADEFPEMLSFADFPFKKVRASTFSKAIDKTAFAISNDEMRYNLNGAYIETDAREKDASFRMVATDGHRLAMNLSTMEPDETFRLEKGVIIPRKGVMELKKLLAEEGDDLIEIAVNDTNAAFKIGKNAMYMRLIVGEFPDYRSVIPKSNKKKLVVNRELMTHSLKRVSLLSEGKSKCVKLGLKDTAVLLAATTPELGEAEEVLKGEFQGEALEIGFNARYLLDALSVTTGDNIILELDHEQSPGIIRAMDDACFLGVIMPMRI